MFMPGPQHISIKAMCLNHAVNSAVAIDTTEQIVEVAKKFEAFFYTAPKEPESKPAIKSSIG